MKHETLVILILCAMVVFLIQWIGRIKSQSDKDYALMGKYVFLIKDYERLARDMQRDLSACKGEKLDRVIATDWENFKIGSCISLEGITFKNNIFEFDAGTYCIDGPFDSGVYYLHGPLTILGENASFEGCQFNGSMDAGVNINHNDTIDSHGVIQGVKINQP